MMALVLTCVLVLVPALPVFTGDDAPILWGEKRVKLAELPANMPASARAAVEAWHPWASASAYRMDLDAAGRVLLVSRASNGRAPDQLALAAAVVARFDEELPAPAVRREVAAPIVVAKAPEPPPKDGPIVPEDPEDPDGGHPWTLAPPKPVERTVAAPVVTTWGAEGRPLDTDTLVLFVATDQDDFESLLRQLAEKFPYLERWAKEAEGLQGFVVGDPLAGAYLERADGQEEWHPDHEVVNRVARMCLLRRYGELPNWLVQGYAWHMEIALLNAVYCFPWRDEFVFAVEHSAWPGEVKRRYAKDKLLPAHFMGWKRGKYDGDAAKASWGMTEYLVTKERAKLPELLDHLRAHRAEKARIQDDPSSWRRDTDYEIPVPEQQKLFLEHLGPKYLESATLFCRKEIAP
jgi:hypothetical protein